MLLVVAACGSSPSAPDAAQVAIDASVDAPGPGISISPHENDFGSVVVGSPSAYATFEISTGSQTGPLSVAFTGTNAGQFTTVGGNCDGAVLAPPSTCTVWVAFRPTTFGAKAATLTILGSPGGTAMASLLGTGLGPPSPYPTPSFAHFGTTVVGQSTATQRLTFTNPGGLTTSALSITKAGTDPTQFEIVTDTCMGQMIGPNATCFVDVRFHPTSFGQKTSSIIFSATTGGSANAALDGTGIASTAAIAITSPISDFGTVGLGATIAPVTFTATNTGGSPTAALATSIVQSVSQFAIVAGTDTCSGMTLAAGAACTLQIKFTGVQPGSAFATLRVGDGTTEGTTSLAAVVASIDDINIPSPSLADFPDVAVGGTSAPIQIALTNIGGNTHGPVALTFGGANAAAFAQVNESWTSTSLGPAAFCTVGVTFSPSSSGIQTGFVQFAATPGGTATVALRGTGVP